MNGHPESSPKLALISVSDKSGIVEFARRITALGFSILSTGGTARALADAGIGVIEVSEFTGFPEIMGGRVKTLHPRIHGGLLGRTGTDEAAMAQHDIPRIALAVINLYPFEKVICKPGATLEEAIENIDIGGPAMVRSAAKNHAAVGIVTSPDQYPEVLSRLERNQGELDEAFRFELAVAAFNRIAQYDAAISNYLSGLQPSGPAANFPRQANGCFQKVMDLRYGENPHQAAAFYRQLHAADDGVAGARQLQGKDLSFNNIADADAAWTCAQQFDQPACVIVKHANPCGVAVDTQPRMAYRKAHATDPASAFGGVIAFNCEVDEVTAREVMEHQFVEVLIAPAIGSAAVQALAQKPGIRLLQLAPGNIRNTASRRLDFKSVGGGVLLQWADEATLARDACKVVSAQQPDEGQWADLLFAWRVVKMVKSNAIVFAAGGQTLGIGAGQMSRVDSTRIARWKAGEAGLDLSGSVMASDAFFPFRDGIDSAAEAGIACVIQPGGSVRDEEVIAAANAHGMAMVFTGMRHFRH